MADVSKMVAARVAISRTVISSLEVHGADVSAELAKILFPKGSPKQLTVEGFVQALAGALQRSVDDLVQADRAHAQELSDDDAPRAARDSSVADVREQLINLRSTLLAVYGPSVLKAYGLAGETPEDAEMLLSRANNTASLLTTRELSEKPRQKGVTVDPKALAKSLSASAKVLEKALGDVRREEREGQLTRQKRDSAALVQSGRYQGVADLATGIFELCGRSGLADVVRPTARRRAGLVEAADEVSEESDAPPAEAPPPETPS